MQLVLPKGKVEANLFAVFSTPCGYPYGFPNFLNMEITVNHQNYHLNTGCSVAEMLYEVLQTEPRNIAVAINQSIVAKSNWHAHRLLPGDQVILIKATQGG